jgi:hypothetical protein
MPRRSLSLSGRRTAVTGVGISASPITTIDTTIELSFSIKVACRGLGNPFDWIFMNILTSVALGS